MLLDRHPIWLDAVERVINEIGIDTVAKTTAPSRALELIDETRPDVFFTCVDVRDAELDGLECVRRAQALQPSLRSIVLSSRSDTASIDAALEAGAAAFVIKTVHPADLASAVRQAFEHSVFLAGATPPLLTGKERGAEGRSPTVTPAPELTLTSRELEILLLVAEGHSNATLARMLWVTEQTIKFHLSNIYRKLGVSNRTEASRYAHMRGLLTGEPLESVA